jgi:hypothetical protein
MKYLISSFPEIKTVAYTHLPDTIWRPLFIGTVSNPMGVTADPLKGRLYVADTDLNKIFWYQLVIQEDGLLKTDGQQHVAVDSVTAYWMTVDGLGDLYFTGKMVGDAAISTVSPHRSVFRMDVEKINVGDALNPKEVYTTANSGYPLPHVQDPSGIAVDSFDIYWGNSQNGTTNGAVCKGTRQNIKSFGPTNVDLDVISRSANDVRGVAMAGQSIFWLAPQGIFGADKSASSSNILTDESTFGLIQSAPGADGWDPKSIAFDGENTMYWTETKTGIIYKFPTGNTLPHPIKKYVDAPQVYGITVYAITGDTKKASDFAYGTLQTSAIASESNALSNVRLSLPAALVSAVMALLA